MNRPLLIEIGVEELPAVPFLKELPNIKAKWQALLESYALQAEFEFFYTPRRLILWHREFPIKQADKEIELYGAPLAIAYKDGEPTGAAIGFAKKCGIEVGELKTTQKDGKEVLYHQETEQGKSSREILPIMIAAFLQKLHFGKSMRWGDEKEAFIRPIRWIGCMLGSELIDISLYGVKSAKESYGHRTLSYAPFTYTDSGDFFCQLSKNGVVLKSNERKEMILSQFEKIEKEAGCKIEIDPELLEEVVAITEHPQALIGSFDKSFLKLPDEVIITSMKEHQRYFAVFNDKGELQPHFIVVSNAITEDFSKIVKGNEKVLHARLSDGLFFYENDLKNGLQTEGLANITFMQGAGSLADKSKRESKIALYLADGLGIDDKTLLERSVSLSKADLLSDMVYEFTELQGLMGYYYAKEAGEDPLLALALKEQYLPDGEDADLPSTPLSAAVAMSHKLDSLFTLFSLGKIPTGTKDPFALRRAAIGVIKIVLDQKMVFDLNKDISALAAHYNGLDPKELENFFLDRILQYFSVNNSIIQAVIETGERDLGHMAQKIEALDALSRAKDFKAYSSTFKRVANIIKDVDFTQDIRMDSTLFTQDEEKELFSAYEEVRKKNYTTYYEQLEALFGLKPHIDAFFDKVMVNVEDEKVKENRKNLITSIYLSFKEIADIKEIRL